jgi:hypothetical protein
LQNINPDIDRIAAEFLTKILPVLLIFDKVCKYPKYVGKDYFCVARSDILGFHQVNHFLDFAYVKLLEGHVEKTLYDL